jgi:hypothetical protein
MLRHDIDPERLRARTMRAWLDAEARCELSRQLQQRALELGEASRAVSQAIAHDREAGHAPADRPRQTTREFSTDLRSSLDPLARSSLPRRSTYPVSGRLHSFRPAPTDRGRENG